MPKPTDLPRWNTDATNRTTPTSGQMDTGIVLAEAANSSRMNWLLFTIYSWILWLDGVLTTDGGFTALANAHLKVSGTGRLKHGSESIWLHANDFEPDDQHTDDILRDNSGTVNQTGAQLFLHGAIPLVMGKRVTAVAVLVKTSATAGSRSAAVQSTDLTGSTGTIVNADTDSGTSTVITLLPVTGLPFTVGDFPYGLLVSVEDGDQLLGAKITYDEL